MSKRLKKVADAIQQELGQIIIKEATDPNLNLVSITKVEVSPDLRHAHVFVTSIQVPIEKALKSLQKAKGMLKLELVKKISLKYTPDLVFFEDRGLEHTLKIGEILRDIKEESNSAEATLDKEESEKEKENNE